MPVVRKEGSPFWYTDFYSATGRVRVSTKQRNKGAAQQAEAALIQKLSNGGNNRKAPALRDFSPRFLDHIDKSRLDDDTKVYYRNGWRILQSQDIACMRIDSITQSTASTVKAKGSGSNVNCALRTLRRMFSLAEEWGVLSRKPRIALADEIKRERVITPEEEVIFLANACPTLGDVYLLMMDEGTRPSEAVALDWEQSINLIDRWIFIKSGKTAKARRRLHMTDRVYEMLKARASNGSKWAFPSPSRKGEHIKAKSISVMASALKRKLSFPDDLVLYSARHTFGTDFQSGNGDLAKTSKAMGHSAISTTARYIHADLAQQAKIMNARNLERHNFGHSKFAVQ